MESIQVKVTRAEKRGRKIILVIESDLYSDEIFAVTPFYNEGDIKNQLQEVRFNLKVAEKSGKIEAKVDFDNCLHHFTKGHSQIHQPLNTFFIDRKDCARNWALTEEREYYKEDRISKVLNQWSEDKEFHSELSNLIKRRLDKFKSDDLEAAKKNYEAALLELDKQLKKL